MKQIKFYISNIDPNLLNSICGRSGELISLIRSEKIINEETLRARLFTGKWSYQNYLNLRNRTRKILEAYFLISPTIKENKILKKNQESRKAHYLAMQFIERYKREEANSLLLQSYKIADEYGFTQLAYNSAFELMAGFSLKRKASKFEKFRSKVKQLRADLEAEDIALQYYYQVNLNLNKKRGVIRNEQIEKCLEHLETFSCQSNKFIQYYYTLRVLHDLNIGDYQAIKKNTRMVLNMLSNRIGVYKSTLQFFTKYQAIAHTVLREYPQAKALYLTAEQYAPPRSYNRGIIYYYQAINALHSGEYQIAYDLYRQHRKTKFETLSEQWAVIGAYMYFLRSVGKLQTGSDRFSIGKYLNETVPTTHDKTGNKINTIIGELLVCLIKDRDRFIDRVEGASHFAYKYLKGDDTRRAKWFIRILCLMPRANFHPVALARLAQKQLDNLEAYPIHMGNNISVEIIPFGALWEMVAKQLKVRVA